MSDAVEATSIEDPAQAISLGKRHLLVGDYVSAVSALADGCSALAERHGDQADELGEPFLLYGRALLCLSREQAGVLGSGVPGNEEADEEEEDDEAAPEEEEPAEGKENGQEKKKENGTEKPKEGEKEVIDKPEEKEEAKKTDPETADAAPAAETSAASGSDKEKPANGDVATASTSSASHQNGDVHENGDEDAEDVEEEEEDDDDANDNLKLAWEILDLAKIILLKRGPPGWKLLAEAHRLLGEVAMESGNQHDALTDLNSCLDLLRKMEPADPRSMAEIHYQIGLAHSLGNEFDASIEQFMEARSLLETRITELESSTEPPPSDDPSYSVESEIKELKELLPELQEKITDMRESKQQACQKMIEGIKSHVAAGSCSNGAGPSGISAAGSSSSGAGSSGAGSSSSKPISDISHLVRKKRKPEEEDLETQACKKPTPEKLA